MKQFYFERGRRKNIRLVLLLLCLMAMLCSQGYAIVTYIGNPPSAAEREQAEKEIDRAALVAYSNDPEYDEIIKRLESKGYKLYGNSRVYYRKEPGSPYIIPTLDFIWENPDTKPQVPPQQTIPQTIKPTGTTVVATPDIKPSVQPQTPLPPEIASVITGSTQSGLTVVQTPSAKPSEQPNQEAAASPSRAELEKMSIEELKRYLKYLESQNWETKTDSEIKEIIRNVHLTKAFLLIKEETRGKQSLPPEIASVITGSTQSGLTVVQTPGAEPSVQSQQTMPQTGLPPGTTNVETPGMKQSSVTYEQIQKVMDEAAMDLYMYKNYDWSTYNKDLKNHEDANKAEIARYNASSYPKKEDYKTYTEFLQAADDYMRGPHLSSFTPNYPLADEYLNSSGDKEQWLRSQGYVLEDYKLYKDSTGKPCLKFKYVGKPGTKPPTQIPPGVLSNIIESTQSGLTVVQTPSAMGDSEYEIVTVNNLSGVNPMNFTSLNTWLAGIRSSSSTTASSGSSSSGSSSGGGGGSSGGGSGGALATGWGSVGGTSMANLILGGSSTLTSGASSSPNVTFTYTPGGAVYGAVPQNGYYWCDTGMTNTRNRALGTTNTDRVKVGGASGITYIVTHTANTSGVTVTNITK
jgi:hypothetical protein